MNHGFQELSFDEIELVSGSSAQTNSPVTQLTGIDYPIIENNPPG